MWFAVRIQGLSQSEVAGFLGVAQPYVGRLVKAVDAALMDHGVVIENVGNESLPKVAKKLPTRRGSRPRAIS